MTDIKTTTTIRTKAVTLDRLRLLALALGCKATRGPQMGQASISGLLDRLGDLVTEYGPNEIGCRLETPH